MPICFLSYSFILVSSEGPLGLRGPLNRPCLPPRGAPSWQDTLLHHISQRILGTLYKVDQARHSAEHSGYGTLALLWCWLADQKEGRLLICLVLGSETVNANELAERRRAKARLRWFTCCLTTSDGWKNTLILWVPGRIVYQNKKIKVS